MLMELTTWMKIWPFENPSFGFMHMSNYESYSMRIYYSCDIFHLVVDLGIISKQEAPTRPLHIVSPRNVATYIPDPQYMYPWQTKPTLLWNVRKNGIVIVLVSLKLRFVFRFPTDSKRDVFSVSVASTTKYGKNTAKTCIQIAHSYDSTKQ